LSKWFGLGAERFFVLIQTVATFLLSTNVSANLFVNCGYLHRIYCDPRATNDGYENIKYNEDNFTTIVRVKTQTPVVPSALYAILDGSSGQTL